MVNKFPVYNLTFSDPELYNEFIVEDKYKFVPDNPLNVRGSPREVAITYQVEYDTPDSETLIWRSRFLPDGTPGRRGQNKFNSEVRGHIEDVILFMSFLNSSQVALGGEGREDMPDFPVYSRGSLPPFSGNSKEMSEDIKHCMKQLRNKEWATKFHNFFPIIHFTYTFCISFCKLTFSLTCKNGS